MPLNMPKRGSETQVKNKMSEQKEESRYRAGTKISPASGTESRRPHEPPEPRFTNVGATKSHRPDWEPARTEASIQIPRSRYREQNGREPPTTSAQKPTSTDITSHRSVDPRGRGNIDDKPVSRTHPTQSSDESHAKSTPTSSLSLSKSSRVGSGQSLRSDEYNVNQYESLQSNNRPSSQRTSTSVQNTGQALRNITSLPPYRDDIVSLIELVEEGDYVSFGRFVNAHLDSINNDGVSNTIRGWAKAAVQNGDQRYADRCAKTLALIDVCQTLSRARTTYFLSSLIREDDDSVRQEFEMACAKALRECVNESNSEQQKENPVDRKSARSGNTWLPNPKKREMGDANEDPRKISRMMLPDTGHDDLRKEFPERLSKWFKRGKLFKMWERVARDNEPRPRSSSGSHTSKQSRLTSGLPDHTSLPPPMKSARTNQVRSMYYLLVVQVSGDFCTVLRARSHWYSGLSRKGLNSPASRSYAILYSKESELPPSGHGFKKEPIKIDLTPEGIGLKLPMRIDFEKYQIVKVPTRAEEVGNVSEGSTKDFDQYCEESML